MNMLKSRLVGLILALFLLVSTLGAVVGLTETAPTYIWTMDTAEEVAAYDNDNTGATLSWSTEVVCQGSHSLAVTPSGKALETKVAIPLAGDKILLWVGFKTIILNFYLHAGSKPTPSMFFLGMADVSNKEFNWIDGIFAKPTIQDGWNQVRYALSPGMRKLDATHQYKIFLAFAAQDGSVKTPLTDKFYLDGIYGEVK